MKYKEDHAVNGCGQQAQQQLTMVRAIDTGSTLQHQNSTDFLSKDYLVQIIDIYLG